MDRCIRDGVLAEFFREHREEIIKMAIIDMTWEKREPLIRAEEFNDGYDTGYDTARNEDMKIYIKTLEDVGTPKDSIIELLVKNFSVDRQTAESIYDECHP